MHRLDAAFLRLCDQCWTNFSTDARRHRLVNSLSKARQKKGRFESSATVVQNLRIHRPSFSGPAFSFQNEVCSHLQSFSAHQFWACTPTGFQPCHIPFGSFRGLEGIAWACPTGSPLGIQLHTASYSFSIHDRLYVEEIFFLPFFNTSII